MSTLQAPDPAAVAWLEEEYMGVVRALMLGPDGGSPGPMYTLIPDGHRVVSTCYLCGPCYGNVVTIILPEATHDA